VLPLQLENIVDATASARASSLLQTSCNVIRIGRNCDANVFVTMALGVEVRTAFMPPACVKSTHAKQR
jgi:hypothetical protein